jgi:tetratricopeptide (TPR) repeat protein
MKKLIAGLGALCLALTPCSLVFAAPSAELAQSAASHFEKGVELYREGSLDAALVEFERAYELIPNYRLLFNLAQIQAERHDYAAAIGFFEKYLQTGAAQIPEARRAEAQREIEKLRTRVAYLRVESNVEGAQLFVNDSPVALLPLSQPLAINPGVSSLRLEKAGYLPTVHQIKVAGGERPRLSLPLVEASGRGPDDASAARSGSANFTPFWISATSTAAFGVATLALGLTARSANRDLDDELGRFPPDEDQVAQARSRLKLYSALTDSCAAASVVALGVAVYFLIDPPKTPAHPGGKASRRSLRFLAGHRGVALHGSF